MQWAWAIDLARELRYFWPAGSCGGPTWSLLILLALVTFLAGLCLGCCGALTLTSPSRRRACSLVVSAAAPAFVGPEVVVDNGLQLRRRLAQYRGPGA